MNNIKQVIDEMSENLSDRLDHFIGSLVEVEELNVDSNGTYTAPSGKAYSPVVVNVDSSGGPSNVVTGTFTGTTSDMGKSLTIRLPYDGDGQPIVLMIYPSDGPYNSNSTFGSTVQQYAAQMFVAVRDILPLANTSSTVISRYKSSSTSAILYDQTGASEEITFTGNPVSEKVTKIATCVKGTSGTFLWVLIANTSYGFMANVPYDYQIIFSE